MKKAITILAICSLLLTACGQIDDTESKAETTTAIASESTSDEDTAETSSAKGEKDTSEATTTILKTSSQTVSSSSKPTGTTVTTTKISGSSNANGYSNQGQNNSVQNNNGQVNNYQPSQNNQQQPDNSPSDNDQSNNGVQQNDQPIDNKPQTTTAKPAVTNKPTTTTPKPQTTVPQTEPPAPEPDNQVVDINAVSDQMWVFLECYPIDYNGMYEAGKQLSNDGSDISKARSVSNYAYNQGGRNCIEYALNAYFLAKGAGLECYIARSSKYDWNGHVANVIKLDGKWYYMESQEDIVGSPTTYAAGGIASDGSAISYPDGLDVVTDIYDNQISIIISENWYE